MDFSILLIFFAGTFLLAAGSVWAARWFLHRSEENEAEPEETARPNPFLDEADAPLLLRGGEVSSISLWALLLEKFDIAERMKATIARADINWTAGRVTLAMLFCATAAFAILSGWSWLPVWAMLAGSLFAGMLPYLYILRRKDKRMRLIEDQFPDAIESLARALRAGHPLASGLDLVGNQTPNPLGREFRKVFAEGALGQPWDQALENLTNRLPLQEVCLFAASVKMHGKSGGNLAEVLDKLSENMREAAAIRGEVRTLSSQGRMAGTILTILPIFIACVLFYVNPGFILTLFTDELGKILLLSSVGGLIAAHFIIRKLVDIQL